MFGLKFYLAAAAVAGAIASAENRKPAVTITVTETRLNCATTTTSSEITSPNGGLICPFQTTIPKISRTGRQKGADFCFKSSDGVCICSHISGCGPPVVVMSPGWGVGKDYLQNGLGKYLEDHFTVIYLSTRGTPPSTQPSDSTRMGTTDMANDLETLRIRLGEEKLTLLGHSHAGAQAILYAQLFPDRVAKMALLEPELIGFDQSAAAEAFAIERADKPQYASSIAANIALNAGQVNLTTDEQFGNLINDILPYYFADPVKNFPIFEKTLTNLPAIYAQTYQPAADGADFTLVPVLGEIQAPTLIINGKEDAIVTPAMAAAVHEGISGSELLLIENSGHFGWIETPGLIIPWLVEFLST